jgi:putative transposase
MRLKYYDYGENGFYFITINTYYHRPYLVGENRKLVVQTIDQLASRIPGVSIDYYVLMPTHVHLIIVLAECTLKLGEIVRRLKAVTSKYAGYSLWQPNYYEHVIRHEEALRKIRAYIVNNPLAEKIKCEQFY